MSDSFESKVDFLCKRSIPDILVSLSKNRTLFLELLKCLGSFVNVNSKIKEIYRAHLNQRDGCRTYEESRNSLAISSDSLPPIFRYLDVAVTELCPNRFLTASIFAVFL